MIAQLLTLATILFVAALGWSALSRTPPRRNGDTINAGDFYRAGRIARRLPEVD